MAKRRKLAQELSDEAKIARARKKIAALGLDEKEVMPKLLEKYGVLAYDFVNKACMEPGKLCNRTGEKFLTTKKLIERYATEDIEPAVLAKAINKKPEEVVDKSAAYRITQAQAEESKPEEIKEIERTAEVQSVRARDLIARYLKPKTSADILKKQLEAMRQAFHLEEEQKPAPAHSGVLRPEYDENTPEGRAMKKAQERLAQLKEGKEGELSFADLKKNGVNKADMCVVMTQDRLGEVSSSKNMEEMSRYALVSDRKRSGIGRCAAAVGDTLRTKRDFDYRNYESRRTATGLIEAMRKSDKFICFDYDSNMCGNPKLDNVKAKGTIIGYSGERGAIQPAGHISMLGHDEQYHSDHLDPRNWLFGAKAAKRYGAGGKGTVSVIFDKDATVTDQMAQDMLYQQYLREEKQKQYMIAYNNQASR